jgi:NTE family protein
LTDYTLPLLSIDTGKRYIGMLERMFTGVQIEDMPLNFFCISCNLTLARPMVHRRGSLAKWIGASVSVPGIAPPLVESGELLVDGGLLNNLPVDIIKGEGAGTVVGVDVSPDTDLRMPDDYSGRPGAMEVLRSRVPFGRRRDEANVEDEPQGYPTLGNILYRATCLSSIYQKESLKDMADLYIKLPVSEFKMLEWGRLDDLIEIGYQVGKEKLAPIAEARG